MVDGNGAAAPTTKDFARDGKDDKMNHGTTSARKPAASFWSRLRAMASGGSASWFGSKA